jgi:polyisoprenoid-binding protein YceI
MRFIEMYQQSEKSVKEENQTMAARYILDPNRSRFTVQVFATGVLSKFGHSPIIAIRDFTGEVQFDPQAPEHASVTIVVKAASLEVTGDVSQKDRQEIETRMRAEVLDVRTYLEVVFRSTSVSATKVSANWYRVQITGDLSLHGVTSKQQVEAQVRLQGDNLSVEGAFTLRQSEYNIKPVSALAGAIKLKDELKGSFNMAAHKEGG